MQAWLFTSLSGVIMKKAPQNITPNMLLDRFSSIAASYFDGPPEYIATVHRGPAIRVVFFCRPFHFE
jgi:hypothetical protein